MQAHYTPTAAAALVGVSVSSLRNWCRDFADNLSEGASPPTGTERKLTAQDIAILQRVKDLRGQGMTTEDIKAALQTEDVTALQPPYIDVQPTAALQPTPPVKAAEGPQPIDLYTAILSHTTALQARMDALQAQQDSQARAATGSVTLFAVGVLVGLVLALIVVGVLWLAP